MNIIQKILDYPIARLILRGIAKALIIALVASLLFAAFVTYRLYGPTFDKNYHLFGTSSDFLIFALVFTSISSIPVSLLTSITLTVFLRADRIKNRISYKRSFVVGFLVGGIIGAFGAIIVANQVGDNLLYLILVILACLGGGLGGLWMTKDALRLFPQNIE